MNKEQKDNPYRHKLTIEAAQRIRRLFKSGYLSEKALGREYGVSVTAIRKVIQNKSYVIKGI